MYTTGNNKIYSVIIHEVIYNVIARVSILADPQSGKMDVTFLRSGSRYKERIYPMAIVSKFSESAVIISPSVKVKYEGTRSAILSLCLSYRKDV